MSVKEKRPQLCREEKRRYILHKSKKRWLVKGLVFGSVILSGGLLFAVPEMKSLDKKSDANSKTTLIDGVIEKLDELLVQKVIAATNSSTQTIDTVTTTGNSQISGTGSNVSNVMSGINAGKNGVTGGSSVSFTPSIDATGNASLTTAMVNPMTGSTASSAVDQAPGMGAVVFNNQITFSQDFSLTYTILSDANNTSGNNLMQNNGIFFTPSKASDVASAFTASSTAQNGGLGITGLPNSFGLFEDGAVQSGYQSNSGNNNLDWGSGNTAGITPPQGGTPWQYTSWRYTDSNGQLISVLNSPDGWTNAAGGLSWNNISNSKSTQAWPVTYTLTYTASSGLLNITQSQGYYQGYPYQSIFDKGASSSQSMGNMMNGSIQTGVNQQTVTTSLLPNGVPASNNSGDVTFTTTVPQSLRAQTYTIGILAAKGGTPSMDVDYSKKSVYGSNNSVTVSQYSATAVPSINVTIQYQDASGNTLKPSTSMTAVSGDTIGINSLSPNATSDNWSYNAPDITGYTAVSANDVTVSASNVNTLTIVYQPNVQTTINLVDRNGNPIKDSSNNPITVVIEGYQGQTIGTTSNNDLLNAAQAKTAAVGYSKLLGTYTSATGGGSVSLSSTTLGPTNTNANNTVVDGGVTYYLGPNYYMMMDGDVQQASATVNYLLSAGLTPGTSPLSAFINTGLNNASSPLITNGVQQLATVTGQTSGTFSISIASNLLGGYYTSTPSITGTYDNTANGSATSDSSPQFSTVYALPSQQSLNINYTFPTGYTPSGTYTQIVSGYTFETFDLSKITVPQVPGYVAQYSYQSAPAQTSLPSITADNTSNGTSTLDAQPQTLNVTYKADYQEAQVVIDTSKLPTGNPTQPSVTTNETSKGFTAGSISFTTTDTQLATYTYNGNSTKIGLSYTVTGPDGKSYPTLAQALTANPQFDNTDNSSTSDSSPQTFTVVYTAWTAQMNYYVQQVDSNNNPIGSLTLVSSLAGQTQGTDFTQTYGSDVTTQTTKLQNGSFIPQGYHVTNSYWSNQPDGSTQDKTPPYTNDWTFDNMSNVASGASLNEQASIVYVYTADSQQATVTITGAPTNSVGVSNGPTTYSGYTSATQNVLVPAIDGYLVSVSDTSAKPNADNFVFSNNGNFSFTYDNNNNGTNTTDDTPQTFTIAYVAKDATVQVNYQYSANTTTTVNAAASTDTSSYKAPALPSAAQINTKTDGTYSLDIPDISGYTWTVTDSNGKSYTKTTLPASFTNDGNNISYTVSYTATNSTININFYEATYNPDGSYSFTTNAVAGMSKLTYTGAVGSTQSFAATTGFIQNIPAGWTLDPMNAATSAISGDNDNLNGANTAKQLVFMPTAQNYIVYLARDIQSVQAKFVNDPQSTGVLYQDGRTGMAYSVDTSSFTRAGYTYAITDPNGKTVSAISGTYDNTSNGNANSAVLNNGDGDTNPQVYTVTYTADYQEAQLTGVANSETLKGTTGANIQFSQSDSAIAKSGYYYTVTVGNKSYATLNAAIADNKYFDNTDNTGPTDKAPQVFAVTYYPSYQQAQIMTDASDPKGAAAIEVTNDGLTGGNISFDTTDAMLARPGYSYTVAVTGDTTSYSSLATALSANPTYDSSNNGTNNQDIGVQTFTVSYTPNAQTVSINYVYSSTDRDNISGSAFNADGTLNTTSNPSASVTGTPATATMSVTGVSNGTATNQVNVPVIAGYTANITQITPSFTIDSVSGQLITPTITVTYTANAQIANISYQDDTGTSLNTFAASCNQPLLLSGVTNQQIMANPPVLPGYDFKTLNYTTSGEVTSTPTSVSDLYFTTPDDKNDLLNFVYTAKTQTVNIVYVNSVTGSSMTFPDGTSVQYTATGTSNSQGGTIPVPNNIDGYNASATSVTPDFTVDNQGNLVTPTITVKYTPTMQTATISYISTDGTDLSGKVPNAPTLLAGTTDALIQISAPSIPGYNLSQTKYNANVLNGDAVYTAGSSSDTIEYIYTAKQLSANVHYLFSLPSYYNGTYNGNQITYAANNNKPVPNVDESYLTISGQTDQDITINPWTTTGWTDTPSGQTVTLSVGSDEKLLTSDYYFYITPNEIAQSNIPVLYTSSDGNNAPLLASLQQAMSSAMFSQATVAANMAMNYTGAIEVLGYNANYPTYSYASIQGAVSGSFIQYNTLANGAYNSISSNDTTYQSTPFTYDGSQSPNVTPIDVTYTPNTQTINIAYVYGSNGNTTAGQPVPTSVMSSATPVTSINGRSNGDTWAVNEGSTLSNNPISIPTVAGYTASISTIAPNFAIDSTGALISGNSIQVTYTANPQSASFTYVDSNGKDITAFAAGAGAPASASGVTDGQILKATPNVPGYTIASYSVDGGITTQTDLTQLPNVLYADGANNIQFTCTANAQKINVKYIFLSGAKAGQDVFAGNTDSATGVSNGTSPATFTNIQTTPTGYSLATSSTTLNLDWTINTQGKLNHPDIYYYYQPNLVNATIAYGLSSTTSELNPLVPSGTLVGTQTGYTDDPVLTSGAVDIAGYTFSKMVVTNSSNPPATYNGNAETPTMVYYVYTANKGTVTYSYVDQDGNVISPPTTDNTVQTAQSIPVPNAPTINGYTYVSNTQSSITMSQSGTATVQYKYQANTQKLTVNFVDNSSTPKVLQEPVTLSGRSNQLVDYSPINANIQGYTLITDPRSSNIAFDANDSTDQSITLVYQPNPAKIFLNFKYYDGKDWQTLQVMQELDGTTGADVSAAINELGAFPGYKWLNTADAPTTYDAIDTTDQFYTFYLAPEVQSAILVQDGTDPNALGTSSTITETDKGYTKGMIAFRAGVDASQSTTDNDLVRAGYKYTVTGPDEVQYDSLSIAIANNPKYDNTDGNNPTTSDYPGKPQGKAMLARALMAAAAPVSTVGDSEPQVFTVSYIALPQTAIVKTKNDPSGDKTYEGVSGLSDGIIGGTDTPSLNVTDEQLVRQGYTYTVDYGISDSTAASGYKKTATYDTLAVALTANPRYDTDTSTNQMFVVNYVADQQTVLITTDSSDPTGAKTAQTITGGSSSLIPQPSASAIYRKGYLITKVLAPDGKTYDNMSSALAMNANFDNNDLIDGVDGNPQTFVISYTPIVQRAAIILKNDPNATANQTIETTDGNPNDLLHFTTTDASLTRDGYTYKVTSPDGKKYNSLRDALIAYNKFAPEDLVNGTVPVQNFLVEYTRTPTNNNQSGGNNGNQGGTGNQNNQGSSGNQNSQDGSNNQGTQNGQNNPANNTGSPSNPTQPNNQTGYLPSGTSTRNTGTLGNMGEKTSQTLGAIGLILIGLAGLIRFLRRSSKDE